MSGTRLNALETAMYRDFLNLSGIPKSYPKSAPAFQSAVPKCCTTDQYIAWKEKARESVPGGLGICTDCTPEYQHQMMIEGRCERPLVQFRPDADGMIEGYYPCRGRKYANGEHGNDDDAG